MVSSDALGKFFPSWRKDDLLKVKQIQKIKAKFCADSLALTEIIKIRFLKLWALLYTQ